jgi:hypothetical protein
MNHENIPHHPAPAASSCRLRPSRYVCKCASCSADLGHGQLLVFNVGSLWSKSQQHYFSKHNLSISSPGDVHATTESDICIFCHTPHNATGDGPLWNHQMSSAAYQPYTSSTLKATVGQPTGASRLCLSCHDGTVALGMVHSRSGGIAMNSPMMPAGPNNIGTDLSGRPSGVFHLRFRPGHGGWQFARSQHVGFGSAPGPGGQFNARPAMNRTTINTAVFW